LDRLIEAVAARLAPSGHEGAISELAHGDSDQEDLVSGHQADLRLEPGTAATAERRAEHASVDEDPHESSAAAKASSSSSDNSSIRSASIEDSTGAAASCSSVRSLGKGAMTAFDAEVLDVGGACLAHAQSVQPEKHRQGGVLAVVLLGGETFASRHSACQSRRRGSLPSQPIVDASPLAASGEALTVHDKKRCARSSVLLLLLVVVLVVGFVEADDFVEGIGDGFVALLGGVQADERGARGRVAHPEHELLGAGAVAAASVVPVCRRC
jgi:hypothetical protein